MAYFMGTLGKVCGTAALICAFVVGPRLVCLLGVVVCVQGREVGVYDWHCYLLCCAVIPLQHQPTCVRLPPAPAGWHPAQ